MSGVPAPGRGVDARRAEASPVTTTASSVVTIPSAVAAPVVGRACPTTCTRASVLRAAAAVVVAGSGGVLLASCGDPDAPAVVAAPPSGGGERTSVAASAVPVGGVVSQQVGEDPVVVAQPTAGRYVAYSAVCTHQGGIVAPVGDLLVQCPLHGSEFDLADAAAVVVPPASQPLAEYPLSVEGDQLVLG